MKQYQMVHAIEDIFLVNISVQVNSVCIIPNNIVNVNRVTYFFLVEWHYS